MADMDLYPVPFEHALAVVRSDRTLYVQGDESVVYPLASVTKVIASRAILVAIDQHLMNLDDPLGPTGSTVRHLLAHASGIAADSRAAQVPPETERIYSNAGFDILGEATSEATGEELSRWIELSVLEPLGMTTADAPGSPAYSAVGSGADLIALAQELLAPTLISEDLDQQSVSVQFPDLDGFVPGYRKHRPCPWGLGVEIRGHKSPHWTSQHADPATFGHFGVSGSFIWVDRGRDLAAVFVGTEKFGSWHKKNWCLLNDQILERFA